MFTRATRQARQRIAESAWELQSVIDSGEEVLESLKDQQGAAIERVRERISSTLQKARERLDDLDVPEVASEALDDTIGFIRNDPWRTVAIGALAALTLSLLVRGVSMR